MIVHDRLTRGVASGVAAALSITVALLLYYLAPVYRTRFMDFSAVLLMGHRPHSVDEAIFAWLATFVWVGACGAGLAYLLKLTTSENYVLKGAVFGSLLWFCFYAGASILRLATLVAPPFSTALINLLVGLVWGALTATLIERLEPPVKPPATLG